MAERIGRSIHPAVPDRAAAFLAVRRRLFVSSVDAAGRPWVTILSGDPGFVRAPDPGTLRIEACAHPDDPAARGLRPGRPIGTLAVDFAKRHRSRINGVVRSVDGDVILVEVEQAYANCPKYIQKREETGAAGATSRDGPPSPYPPRTAATLDAGQIGLIRRADTFFIGTAAGHGADASHRGGNPGFVRATADSVEWPDYAGNSMFNTLGNIEASERAGLAFVDFTTGTVLQLTGRAEIVWDAARVAQIPGAERLVRVVVEEVVEIERHLPGPLPVIEYSPFNPPAVAAAPSAPATPRTGDRRGSPRTPSPRRASS
ncbi:MAG: pyridoxamine 5'-phosphate oxidase family protein [Gemmatimonadales bacterium]